MPKCSGVSGRIIADLSARKAGTAIAITEKQID